MDGPLPVLVIVATVGVLILLAMASSRGRR